MKLTTLQIEIIERYILSWDISNKTFYYEILDHFISAVEERMDSTGEEFDYAFPEVSLLFAKHKYKKYKLSRKFLGPKALEMQFLERASKGKFRRTLMQISKVVFSKWVILIALAAVASYFGYLNGFKLMAVLFLAVLNLSISNWSAIKKIRKMEVYRYFLIRIKNESKLSVEDLKRKKLHSEGENILIILLWKILIWVPFAYRVFFSDGNAPAWALFYVMALLVLMLPFSILRFQEQEKTFTV
ncbi:hypothetical protein [Arcticibacterium luteifluviistationis]|uniref:Uncharacterized protein n=1 Tax=Arcticibacterium luteifluviistationis TaxID=1784714 RepID=A0A2Z4GD60_9BACT|nr:hypothetical protein [Arcticibacterium luteifluviistationis]AWV99239.1 hypothetical protein DJ013_14120 [Arcticibacterium luteifluviistationis]